MLHDNLPASADYHATHYPILKLIVAYNLSKSNLQVHSAFFSVINLLCTVATIIVINPTIVITIVLLAIIVNAIMLI